MLDEALKVATVVQNTARVSAASRTDGSLRVPKRMHDLDAIHGLTPPEYRTLIFTTRRQFACWWSTIRARRRMLSAHTFRPAV